MLFDPYSEGLKCRVFDIETTGLYAGHDRIISASFIAPDGSGLTQFFTEDPAAEDFTVSLILQELSDSDAVITYNGASFDLPFVLTRAKKYGLAEKLPLFRHADIYKLLRSYWQLAPSLPSLRQKAVEQVLGLSDAREDLINGGECISLYAEYLNFGRSEAKDIILLHNADDVRQLARITQKLSFLPYDRIAFEQGMLVKFSSVSLFGEQVFRVLTGPASVKAGRLTLNGRIDPPCVPTAYFEDGFELQAGQSGEISLSVNLQENSGLLYSDLNKLPVDQEEFRRMEGYSNGYLVLSDNGEIRYKECMALAKALLSKLA